MEHEDTVLECEMASENISGKWLRNGKELIETENIRSAKEGKHHMLVMSNLIKTDEAVYAFRVGRTTTAAKVSIISQSSYQFLAKNYKLTFYNNYHNYLT